MNKPIVEIKKVNKKFGETHVVHDMNLDIYEGEFLTLLGPSGCGKTTTLRMIGGFESPSDGTILIDGVPVEEKEPFERDVNTVFQSYALFPHMTIYDNVAYGLKVKKVKKAEIRSRVEEMLALVQLSGYEKRYPSQLSGGQKQRVAIARSLINNPKVLLLDEPLGALDLKLRKQMQVELKRLQKKLGITFVYVTHDQEEALTMSDRIAVMYQGYIEQLDKPDVIYEKPVTKFVADFIGESNVLEATVTSADGELLALSTETGEVLSSGGAAPSAGEVVYLSVRPEKTALCAEPVPGFSLRGIVKDQIYVGSIVKCNVTLPNGFEVKVSKLAGQPLPPAGSAAYVSWAPADSVIIRSRDQVIYTAIENMKLG
ncbi:ABC transporter ATP-binding protein [Sporobacter termitidis]|uniref:ABC transporter ATP-binding protein n=1 Tax=Sporobacter termitidis TaxID=44749 RepID=UPI0009347727|nr:ABC transporter ATP-binding protein [Sporobacter termitidis]